MTLAASELSASKPTVVILHVKIDNWQFIWKISNLADFLKVGPYWHWSLLL